MSTAIAKNFQVGADGTATNNFTIRQPATPDGTVRIANGNTGSTTDLVTLTSAGNLGIGTSSPRARLDVNGGAILGTGQNLSWGNVYGAGIPTIAGSSSGLDFYPSGSTAGLSMRLDSVGNLGLGVTPSAWSTTGNQRAIQVGPVGSLSSLSTSSTTNITAMLSNAVDPVSPKYINSDLATQYRQASGAHYWYTAPSGTAGNAITFTQAMTLDASGRLGLGTTSPTRTLSVEGSSSAGSSTGYPSIAITNTNTATQSNADIQVLSNNGAINGQFGAIMSGGESYVRIAALTNHYLQFMTNSVERARIDSSGNLLVGTTSSTGISGWGLGNGIGLSNNYQSNAGFSFNSTSSTGTQYFFGFGRGGSLCGSITSGGANSTTYATSSDYRLKENIQPMTGALAKVAALKPCTYKWKADGSDGEGFIAHELQAVVPDAVVGEKDAVDAEGKPIYQGIDTSFLVATLTAAIQELKAINDAQAQTITALTARVEALEAAKV